MEAVLPPLRDIKKWLQRGEIREAAKEEGLSRAQVNHIMAGKSKQVNWKFVENLVARAERNKAIAQRAGLL